MTFVAQDLGPIGNLAIALGIFDHDGNPNPNWFQNPEDSLGNILANKDQRDALLAFVDEAMGGADRTTDPRGVVWLPIVRLTNPDLTISVTVHDPKSEPLHIGIGLSVRTSGPQSETSLAVPLFRVQKEDEATDSEPLLLGSIGGHIRIATSITIDEAAPVPGAFRLGAIGLDIDLPTTSADPAIPLFGLTLKGFQLPGASSPRDLRVSADGLDELDDALLDLVLSLVKSQVDSADHNSPIAAIGGLLGLKSSDAIPDFPIASLRAQGVGAISAWLHDLLVSTSSRNAWTGYLANLLKGTSSGDVVLFKLGSADLTIALRVETGPSGHALLTPTFSVILGNDDKRVEATADLCQIDLVTGSAIALPRLGIWAAAGGSASDKRILDVTAPTIARADTLRIGFSLDASRRLTFVLAADGVLLGTHQYPTLDLTTPDAVMDAIGNTVEEVAAELFGNLGSAAPAVRMLIGLDAPAGITPISLASLMSDPVGACGGYWQSLTASTPDKLASVLAVLRNTLADASAVTALVSGSGTVDDPWRVPLTGPLAIELSKEGSILSIAVTVATSVDTLGHRFMVIESRLAATIARIDLAAKSANLMPGVEGMISARKRGVTPSRVTLPLGDGAAITASHVGLRLGWKPGSGLSAAISAPNLQLSTGSVTLPVALPVIGSDGSVTLPAAGWDGVEALVGYLGQITGGVPGDIVDVLGWSADTLTAGGIAGESTRLRLAELAADPAKALKEWLPELAMSDLGPQALAMIADLFTGTDSTRGAIQGVGLPDDPYLIDLADGVPGFALWFPPGGLKPAVVAAPEALLNWNPGDPGLSADVLTAALQTEATAAPDVRELIDGRSIQAGLEALAMRWTGGDGRIVPPSTPPAGVTINQAAVAVGQLLKQLDLEALTSRTPTITVYVAIGASAWPDAPAGRRVDLTTPGMNPAMFAQSAAATGDWFVALGSRSDCMLPGSDTDGTTEQAERLKRLLDALSGLRSDITVVALAGAGHAARCAAEKNGSVTNLVTLGTPLGPIALTALSTQPTADALRLLYRLLPPETSGENDDLALGRALIGAMMELVDRVDPAADLRMPTIAPPAPRADLAVNALFGVVSESQIGRAITAVVAAGLKLRAQIRAMTPIPPATGLAAGLRMAIAPSSTGSISIEGSALVQCFAYDKTSGIDTGQHLHLHLRIGDRLGWLAASPNLELRKVTADVRLPLDGVSHGVATVTLHDARVSGQSWEQLVLGVGPGELPALPEARILLAVAIQRITADAAIQQRITSDVAGARSVQLARLLSALGIIAPGGGLAGDAIDQFIHDPGGLIRQRMAIAASEIAAAIPELLGPLASSVDLSSGSVHIKGGGNASGRFGWKADLSLSAGGLTGQLAFGPDTPAEVTGSLNVLLDLKPFRAVLKWRHPGGGVDDIALWPSPDAAALARAMAKAALGLGGQVTLEAMRLGDETAKPIIDGLLDALGLLNGSPGDADRSIRPLVSLLADPSGWLTTPGSLAASPAKIQGLFDALRPLFGVAGAAGSPIQFASGVTLGVSADAPGARLSLAIDPSSWSQPAGIAARLTSGLVATLSVKPAGPPTVGIESYVGLVGAAPGRQAVHAVLSSGGISLFLRPSSGADISLIPFAGLGSLATAAEAALPYLLDRLAEISGTTGSLVQKIGEALALRTGTPMKFDAAALRTWAVDPADSWTHAQHSITSTGLTAIAPLLGSFVPPGVSVTADATTLTVTIGALSLAWNPATSGVTCSGKKLVVPRIEQLNFTLVINAAGLDNLSLTAGPALIDAGGATLRPYVTVVAGTSPPGGRRVLVGMALDDTRRFAACWLLDTKAFALVDNSGELVSAGEYPDTVKVAPLVVEAIADLVASVAMAQKPVQDLLGKSVGSHTVRRMLTGVMLDKDHPDQLISGLFDTGKWRSERIQKLFQNIADTGISINIEGLDISILRVENVIGLQAGLSKRYELVNGDVMLWLENDNAWIEGNTPEKKGLFVGFLETPSLIFKPSLAVYGIGLRIGKCSGPLLDAGVTLESVALHTFAKIDSGGARSRGLQLQFSNLAVSTSGAKGDNGIAQGIMRDTGPTPPKPAFSPALAIQKHNANPLSFTLRAGDGEGPWWIAIQKGFGPLYLEQIGFGTTNPGGQLKDISLLMDGSVSIAGLYAAVDDLEITYDVSRGDFFNPASWSVDLAGLAVSADMAGVSISGGMLKQTTTAGIEYLGMLLGRFAVYGITIYGGYGEGEQGGKKFVAFFAVGAVNGPIGGPPAFFLTGIGGGFGINRKLLVPDDLSNFGDYPLIKSLDIAAKSGSPMDELRKLGAYFPMSRGSFWFAAGLSFNSFAIVDGIAVVAVQIGDGLDINLLGLARMALPRPQVALVSIEVALLVRFSSSEGVLWVQGQLTDNSWLLYPDIKLTGGFAYVIWFKGERHGEFVFTLGGYHPEFHRDGYPEVPRLGLRWSIGSSIVIKAGSYFALTSEALMAGGDFEASAHFGPAWAEVRFGAHGIVYFDPFHYHVNAYARVSAGITIDTWIFGEITISISLGARIDVTGPDFHGSVTFEVGPVELTVEFGGSDKAQKMPISAEAFISKYLEPADDGKALAHAVMTGGGAQPSKGKNSTPDGSATKPFVVVVEFSLTFTSTIPATHVTQTFKNSTSTISYLPSLSIGVAPMTTMENTSNLDPEIVLTWRRDGEVADFPFAVTPRPFGRFPVGVWGLPQDPNLRKVPKGVMIEALNELDLVASTEPSAPGPEVPYYQVRPGPRKPLPLSRRSVDIAKLKNQAQMVSGLVTKPASTAEAFQNAWKYLAASVSPTSIVSLRGERQAPPLLGTLAEGLESPAETVIPVVGKRPDEKVYDHFIDPPVAVGILSGSTQYLRQETKARTSVKGSERAWRVTPPTLASVEMARSKSIAMRLVMIEPAAVSTDKRGTVIGAVDVPPTAIAHASPAIVARNGADGAEYLAGFTAALVSRTLTSLASDGAALAAGQTVVLKMPNAHADAAVDARRPALAVMDAPARVVVLGHGGQVLADRLVGQTEATNERGGMLEIARGAERIVAISQGVPNQGAGKAGLAGWHTGMQMPYAGWSAAVAPGCVVRSFGEVLATHRERLDAGWVSGAELAHGVSTVATTFTKPPKSVIIVVDDPAAFGDQVGTRQLLLGLDGASRARDAAGRERPPLLLSMENRSVLAYDIVPDNIRPVVVSIASDLGWSLAGVMGSDVLDATGAIALLSARGLDAAMSPLAAGTGASLLQWSGPVRTSQQRLEAQALASRRPLAAGRSRQPVSSKIKKGGQR